MTERPILFSAPMVRALLDDRKTQTRRVAKPVRGFEHNNICRPDMAADHWAVWWHGAETDRVGCLQECPYGKRGDRLWVRETWMTHECADTGLDSIKFAADGACVPIRNTIEASELWVVAHDNGRHGDKWRPSIFMPRWASRITLEITDVRVQRVQEISEDDAWAEGVSDCMGPLDIDGRVLYRDLWNRINAKRGYGWDANPFVWAITFRRLEQANAG